MRLSTRPASPFLAIAACCLQAAFVFAQSSSPRIDEETGIAWRDAKTLTIEGQGFADVAAPYDRLPKQAESTVRGAVWSLSRHSTGICVRFDTDSPEIHAAWELISDRLALPHMPATGVSGVDLYVLHEGKWRWLANGRPSGKVTTAKLVADLEPRMRQYMLYLPLYNGVSKVEIGVAKDAAVSAGKPRPQDRQKPIVFYGTSITQGGCASRPGMVHTAILGRWLDRPVINLGFSGNGRMEPEVAQWIAEIDAAVFVIDCLPNISAEQVRENTEKVVAILREAHPETPILLVEDRNYTDSFLIRSKRRRNETSQEALQEVFQKLQNDGVSGLFYLEGDKLLSDDGEGTVDSSHPTDLGFMQHAEAFAPILRKTLGN